MFAGELRRLRGKSTGDPRFDGLVAAFRGEPDPGLRSVILVDVSRVSDSCGFQVPLMEYAGDRDLLAQSNGRKSREELADYQATRNAASLDGLPALPLPVLDGAAGQPEVVGGGG